MASSFQLTSRAKLRLAYQDLQDSQDKGQVDRIYKIDGIEGRWTGSTGSTGYRLDGGSIYKMKDKESLMKRAGNKGRRTRK